MKNFVLGLTAVAGIAASANAAWGYKYQFNTGSGWQSAAVVDVTSGAQAVQFRVIAYCDPGTTTTTPSGTGIAVAFARITGSEKLTNIVTGDVVSGQTRGALSSGQPVYLNQAISAGNYILGTTANTSFASQLLLSGALAAYCPSSGGTPQLEWVVRTGNMTVAQSGPRVINFLMNSRTPTTDTWYHDVLINGVQDVVTAVPDGLKIDVAGTLAVIPAPGALALVGLGGLVAARRRRA